MITCSSCGNGNSDGSKLCSRCGNWIGPSNDSENQPTKVAVNPPPENQLTPPRPYFINRPWFTDWVFWLPVVVATLGGSQSLYREGSRGFGSVTTAVIISGLVTIFITIPFSFMIFGIIPAAIRWPFRKGKFQRLLDVQPDDVSKGWKRDPYNPSGQRWWTGDSWTRGLRPHKEEKIGGASWAIIGSVFAIVAIAFLLGTGNRGLTNQVDLENLDIDSIASQLEFLDSAELSDTMTATLLAESYGDVTRGLNDYFGVKVDPNDIFPAYRQLSVKLDTLDTQQVEMARWLVPTITQEQIGGTASPSLSALRAFSGDLKAFIQVRQNFYAELEKCGPLTATGRVFSDCDAAAFAAAESTLEATNESLQLSYRAVVESMPNQ